MQEFFFCFGRLIRLSSSLQFGIGYKMDSLKVYVIIYSTRTYFPRPTCTKYATCICDKVRKTQPNRSKSSVYMLLVTWLGRNLCSNKTSSFVCHVSLAGYASHIMQL